jgi:hypothetical protein
MRASVLGGVGDCDMKPTSERRDTDTMPGQSVARVWRAGCLFCVWLGIVLFQLQAFGLKGSVNEIVWFS